MAFCLLLALPGSSCTFSFKTVLKGPLTAGSFQAAVTMASDISGVSLRVKKRLLDAKRGDLLPEL